MIKNKIVNIIAVIIVCVCVNGCGSNSLDENMASVSSKHEINVKGTNTKNELITAEKAYIDFMEQDDYANPKKESGELSLPYAFFDINNDGTKELIIAGGYISYQIYTYYNQKVIMIGNNKYGGSLIIYPENHSFYWTGGHKDHYYEEYYEVASSEVEMIAQKSWVVDPSLGKTVKIVYQVHQKKCKKEKYKEIVSKIKQKKKVTVHGLTWYNLKNEEQLEEIE